MNSSLTKRPHAPAPPRLTLKTKLNNRKNAVNQLLRMKLHPTPTDAPANLTTKMMAPFQIYKATTPQRVSAAATMHPHSCRLTQNLKSKRQSIDCSMMPLSGNSVKNWWISRVNVCETNRSIQNPAWTLRAKKWQRKQMSPRSTNVSANCWQESNKNCNAFVMRWSKPHAKKTRKPSTQLLSLR